MVCVQGKFWFYRWAEILHFNLISIYFVTRISDCPATMETPSFGSHYAYFAQKNLQQFRLLKLLEFYLTKRYLKFSILPAPSFSNPFLHVDT